MFVRIMITLNSPLLDLVLARFSRKIVGKKSTKKKSTMSEGPADAINYSNDFLSTIPHLKFNRKVSQLPFPISVSSFTPNPRPSR
jgi:hypothetical protein